MQVSENDIITFIWISQYMHFAGSAIYESPCILSINRTDLWHIHKLLYCKIFLDSGDQCTHKDTHKHQLWMFLWLNVLVDDESTDTSMCHTRARTHTHWAYITLITALIGSGLNATKYPTFDSCAPEFCCYTLANGWDTHGVVTVNAEHALKQTARGDKYVELCEYMWSISVKSRDFP